MLPLMKRLSASHSAGVTAKTPLPPVHSEEFNTAGL